MKYSIILNLCILLLIGCKGEAQTSSANVNSTFQNYLNEAVADKKLNLSGISMTVIAPDLDIAWTGAAGYDSTDKDQKLSSAQPLELQALPKRLLQRRFCVCKKKESYQFDDPISNYISQDHIDILKSDGYNPNMITIKQCLQHRSGLFDYAMGSEAYVQTALKDAKKRWTRTEQIQFAIDNGEPLGTPDAVFGYSDTGYVLLGEILEQLTGKGLAQALRMLLKYEELGLILLG